MRLVGTILAVALSMALVSSCDNKSEVADTSENDTSALEGQETVRLIAMATEKTYLKQNAGALNVQTAGNAVNTRTSVVAGISYRIDHVRISNVVHFETSAVPIPFIREVCGDVKEIYVTVFGFSFIGDDGESSAESSEVMIIFKGDKDYYGCLVNGEGSGKSEFSSHKRLMKNLIDKEFFGTIYQFVVESNSDGDFLTWTSAPILENIPKEVYDLVVGLNNRNEISADDVYFVDELTE
jgi:hypothetical protein